MSRIFDALKKAEQEAQAAQQAEATAAPLQAASRPASRPAEGPAPASVLPLKGWGVVPTELLKELSAVRKVIETRLPGRERLALGVLSSVAGEGATTVLLGFTRTLVSDARVRVLLVDAEGECMELSRTWAEKGVQGWSDLGEPSQVASVIRGTAAPNMDLLPYGNRPDMSPAQAAELLVDAVRVVAQHYDYVLFDCGSVLGTPMTRYLAGALDGMLLVVHASSTRREICLKAIEELQKTQAPLLGVILNRRRYLIPEAIYKRV